MLVEFHAVGLFQARDMTGEFHCGQLHAKTNPQKWNAVFAGITNGFDLSFHPALAEAARHQNTVRPFQQGFPAILFHIFGIEDSPAPRGCCWPLPP